MEYEPDTEFTPEGIPEAVLLGTQTISLANDAMLCLITKAFNDCEAYGHSMRKETVIPAVSSLLHMFF